MVDFLVDEWELLDKELHDVNHHYFSRKSSDGSYGLPALHSKNHSIASNHKPEPLADRQGSLMSPEPEVKHKHSRNHSDARYNIILMLHCNCINNCILHKEN